MPAFGPISPPMPASDDPLAPPAMFASFERLGNGRVLVRDLSVDSTAAHSLEPALARAFGVHDRLAVAVARRLSAESVLAHGVFVLHPKGFVRNGRGAPRDAERFDTEVDAADTGVMIVDGRAFDAARGEAILDPRSGYGSLAMLALSLEVRRRALGRVVAVAEAAFEGNAESDAAFESRGFADEVARSHFRSHFGFDAVCCDLEAVRANPALSALRWNAPIWGAPAGFDKYAQRGAYHWDLYKSHDPFRRRADALISFLQGNLGAGDGAVIDVGAGDALFSGLLARTGAQVVALDPEPSAVEGARQALEAAGLSARVACVQGAAEALPFADGSFRAAMLLDVIEHLRNPVRSLREIRRVLRPGAPLLVATPAWRFGHRNDPVYHLDEYREDELARQLHACGFTIAQTARIKGVYDDIVMIARA